jgi:hypothetical protein
METSMRTNEIHNIAQVDTQGEYLRHVEDIAEGVLQVTEHKEGPALQESIEEAVTAMIEGDGDPPTIILRHTQHENAFFENTDQALDHLTHTQDVLRRLARAAFKADLTRAVHKQLDADD